ncbi:MAG: transposase, partial [Pseudomonadota bacterium]
NENLEREIADLLFRPPAEQWIKEDKQATHRTRLSCHRFRANEVRSQLSVPAYNLGKLWRRLVRPKRIDSWSLTSLPQRLVKTGGRLAKHAHHGWLLLAEGRLTRRLFEFMLRRIWVLPVPAGRRAMPAGDRLGETRVQDGRGVRKNARGVVPHATIRVTWRVSRCAIQAAKHSDPSAVLQGVGCD